MASSINASLTAGIVQTADTSGNLNLQSGGTTIAAITSTGVAVTGTLSSTGNTTLGDASTDTLNVGNGNIVTDASGLVGIGNSSMSSFNSAYNKFVVGTGTGNNGMAIYAGSASSAYIGFKGVATTALQGAFEYDCSTSRLYAYSVSAGVYLASGGTSWTSASDERVKGIIEPITDGLNKVNSLRSVIGKYKTDKEGTRRSFLIAQDVQAVLPEAISTTMIKDDDTEYLGVAYTDVIPLLVASIKELKTLVDAQSALITGQAAEIVALKAKVGL